MIKSPRQTRHSCKRSNLFIQTAITCYGFGSGYDVNQVVDRVMQELDDAPYYRLNEMVEELELELEKGFVGF